MAFESPAKEKILELVRSYEHIASENHAMKIMFETARIGGKRGIPGWRETLQATLANPDCQKATNEAFAPLYAEIEEAIDQAAMLTVLLKVPTKFGPPN